MFEKYNTLSLVQLRDIVKSQGIKNTSTMRKADLVQILCDLEEKQKKQEIHKEQKETDLKKESKNPGKGADKGG